MIFEKIILAAFTLPFIGMFLYAFVFPEDIISKSSIVHEEQDLTVKPALIRFTKWFSFTVAVVTTVLMTFYLYS